jgi:hypothetical protein
LQTSLDLPLGGAAFAFGPSRGNTIDPSFNTELFDELPSAMHYTQCMGSNFAHNDVQSLSAMPIGGTFIGQPSGYQPLEPIYEQQVQFPTQVDDIIMALPSNQPLEPTPPANYSSMVGSQVVAQQDATPEGSQSSRPRVSCTQPGCDKTFGRPQDFRRHLKTKHAPQDASCYQCMVCGCDYSYPRIDKVREHMQNMHGIRAHK